MMMMVEMGFGAGSSWVAKIGGKKVDTSQRFAGFQIQYVLWKNLHLQPLYTRRFDASIIGFCYSAICGNFSCPIGAMTTVTNLRLRPAEKNSGDGGGGGSGGSRNLDLGDGSQVVYVPRFLGYEESWNYFEYLNKHIPWTRPTIRVFGRSSVQPRDTCYVANEGLPHLVYSGYQPHAYSWDEFPPLKDILNAVHKALPGSSFNSLILNRYKGGNDYVSWHADDEKVYGPTPEIASVSFGCEREFLLKRKPSKNFQAKRSKGEPQSKRSKKNIVTEQHSFTLKHGSLLVMRGYTQRDWFHSVPKRAKAESTRINLTFRLVL